MGKTTIRQGVTIKTPEQLALMREAGRIVAHALDAVARIAQPGVSTLELDAVAERVIRRAGAVPSFKGYYGFPATLCTSINEEIVHGIPSPTRLLADGDLLKVDCGAIYQGWHGDAAVSVMVGRSHNGTAQLVRDTKEALRRGIAAAREGGYVGDIGDAIEQFGVRRGYGVVRKYCGHGVGRDLHEAPQVPNYGPAGEGPRLRAGMTLAIEPMLNQGTEETAEQADGWTIKTADGKLSAHFEHTVAVTRDGPQVLTLP